MHSCNNTLSTMHKKGFDLAYSTDTVNNLSTSPTCLPGKVISKHQNVCYCPLRHSFKNKNSTSNWDAWEGNLLKEATTFWFLFLKTLCNVGKSASLDFQVSSASILSFHPFKIILHISQQCLGNSLVPFSLGFRVRILHSLLKESNLIKSNIL